MIATILTNVLGRFAAPFAEAVKIAVIVAGLFAGTWWLRHDAARDAKTAADAQCQITIQKLEKLQRDEADRHADDAQSAGEALPPAPAARHELDRLCAGDEACRDKARLKGH